MLVLSRKKGERIVLSGGIIIAVSEIRGDKVRIAIEAPPHVSIHREELLTADSEQRTEDKHGQAN